jgi:hypothetical protein
MPKPSRFITFRGETKSITEWHKELGVPLSTLSKRDELGVPLDQYLRIDRKPRVRIPGKVATKHPLYKQWQSMRERCNNPKDSHYHDYGGRGVKVCRAWDEDFWAYAADIEAEIGPRPPKHSLDRIEGDRGYEPGNVRWATQTAQMRNTRHNRIVLWDGREWTVPALAEELGIGYHELWGRVYHLKGDMEKVRASVEKLRREGPQPARKLTEAAVVAIRAAYESGRTNLAELGREFNVSGTTISRVIRGRAERHRGSKSEQ